MLERDKKQESRNKKKSTAEYISGINKGVTGTTGKLGESQSLQHPWMYVFYKPILLLT